MNFTLDSDQEAIVEAVGVLLSRHSGPSRLRDLGGDRPRYDHELDELLAESGFADVAAPGSKDRLDAALVQEAVAYSLGNVASAYRLLVWPSISPDPTSPVAIVPRGCAGPARFASDATTIIVLGEDVRLLAAGDFTTRPVDSHLAWPAGQIVDLPLGELVAGVDPDGVRAWVQVAVAVELVGAMRFALDLTVQYVRERHQFGRPIGSFQAVQHGLAECAVAVEGARWLMLESAWNGEAVTAALALTHAIEASKLVFSRTHQYCGAIGFTQEYDLHLATMRLPALTAEARLYGRPAGISVERIWGRG